MLTAKIRNIAVVLNSYANLWIEWKKGERLQQVHVTGDLQALEEVVVEALWSPEAEKNKLII